MLVRELIQKLEEMEKLGSGDSPVQMVTTSFNEDGDAYQQTNFDVEEVSSGEFGIVELLDYVDE